MNTEPTVLDHRVTVDLGPWHLDCTADAVHAFGKQIPVARTWTGRLAHDDGREALVTDTDRADIARVLGDPAATLDVFERIAADPDRLVTIPT